MLRKGTVHLVPAPNGNAAPAWRHEGWVDNPIKAGIESRSPLHPINAIVQSPFSEHQGIRGVSKAGAPELELRDQCCVLYEALIILSPSGRQLQ